MKKTSTRRDLLKFLKKPNFDKLQDLSIKAKIVILLKVLILTYIGLIIAQLPFQILKGLNIIGEISSNVDTVVETITKRNVDFKLYFLISSIFLAPFLEETGFRLFLTKFKINYLITSTSLILGFLIVYFSSTFLWRPKSYLLFSLSSYIYLLIISGVIGFVLWLLRNNLKETKNFWDNNFGIIFYSVAILFALFHFMSINFYGNNLLYAPIILLPFLVYGLSLGYIRIRLGLLYSIALHFIILSIKFGMPELINTLKANTQ
jgi:hypothetical protein